MVGPRALREKAIAGNVLVLEKPRYNTNGTEGPGCLSCPMYGDGLGFCPDELIKDSEVMVLGQGPGEEEEAEGIPFTGRTGQRMDRRFLPLAGLERGVNVSVGNVLKCRWQRDGPYDRTNDLPPEPELRQAVTHCRRAHLRIPVSIKLVIAQGQPAWEACGGPGTVHQWRGYLRPDVPASGQDSPQVSSLRAPVLATVHIAHLNKEPALVVPTMHDWQRARQILDGEWPLPFPPIYDVAAHPWKAVEAFFDITITNNSPLVIDPDFHESGLIWLIGLYSEAAGAVLQLHWIDPQTESWRKAKFLELLRDAIGQVPVIMHNVLADIRAMRKTWGIDWIDFKHLDDTMQAHAVLYVEYDHDLGFLDSLYGKHPRVKHLFKESPELYNAGDCWAPAYSMGGLRKELDRDKLSAAVYADRLALLPIIDESMTRGIRVNKEAVNESIEKYHRRSTVASEIGQSYCGCPINLSSNDQVAYWLYEVEGMPVQKKRGGRKAATVEVSVNKDAVGKLREGFLGFEPQEEPTEQRLAERIALGGHPLLESRWVNQSARQNLSHYLLPLVGRDGTVVARIYHTISIHSQNNARFSYTVPPLAQTPDDLRYIYEPDDDWPWLVFDMDQIELRLIAAAARDWPLLEDFAAGKDVHLVATCQVFGLSPPSILVNPIHSPENADWFIRHNWRSPFTPGLLCDHAREVCGKGDLRRTFGKNFQYRSCFELDASPEAAMSMPAARALGLTIDDMRRATIYWRAAHPTIVAWQRKLIEEGKVNRMTRDWAGTLRRYTDHLDNIPSQLLDHPSQAGCQSIMSKILIQFKREFKDAVYFVYGMHDSANMAIWRPRWDEIVPRAKEIIEQERNIFGISIPFPASFKARGAILPWAKPPARV